MNVLTLPVSSERANAKPTLRGSGYDSDCKEGWFRLLASRSRLSILQTLCEGAKTESEIVATTGVSRPVAFMELESLLDCGCVKSKQTGYSVLYGLNVPRWIELHEAVEAILIASLKHSGFQPTQRDALRAPSLGLGRRLADAGDPARATGVR
jgi:DNA-binding transcriptional ArsR family regulator